jgi:selenocysteine lyase/cysteine desulfurase
LRHARAPWQGHAGFYKLYEEHGGGLRLCPHVYNTQEHVERAVRGVTALSAGK